MTRQEFDRLWDSGQLNQIWNRDRAVEVLSAEAKWPNGNMQTRAAARRALNAFLEATRVVTQ
jgi:hypothetical protein